MATTKKLKIVDSRHNPIPSQHELKQLHATSDAADMTAKCRSNLLELQVDEVLDQVRINYTKHDALKSHLKQMKQIFQKLEAQEVDAQVLGPVKEIQLSNYIVRKPVMLSFEKPTRLDLIGSYLLETGVHPEFNIDVAVEMPQSCFLPKDILNYRYFDKRKLYLGVLKNALEDEFSESAIDIHFENFCGDLNKPILVFKPRYDVKQKYGRCASIRMIPVIEKSTFQLSKLIPSRGNLQNLTTSTTADADMGNSQPQKLPTPIYNMSILEDMNMRNHLEQLHSAAQDNLSFKDAVILGKLWIRQQGFHHTEIVDSLNGFQLSMLLLYLHMSKRINRQMSSWSMFKVLLNFIASESSNLLCFPPQTQGDIPAVVLTPEGKKVFASHFSCTLLDSCGRYNLAFRMGSLALKEIQMEAQRVIQMFQNAAVDEIESFRSVFIQRSSFWTRYDNYFDVYISPSSSESTEILISKMEKVLSRALSDRVTAIRIHHCSGLQELDSACAARRFVIGVRFNPDTFQRTLDKGPAADDLAQAKGFRAFWKTKSELRRFQDGTIIEAVVWDMSKDEQYGIVTEIVQFILPRHISHIVEIVDAESPLRQSINSPVSSIADHTLALWRVFNQFSQVLLKKDSLLGHTLPLEIVAVHPRSSYFRYTALKVPQAIVRASGERKGCVQAIDIVLEFEQSSKWPTSPEAKEQTKNGFLVELARCLGSSAYELECQVVESGSNCLEVEFQGYVFRLSLLTPGTKDERELTLSSRHSRVVHALHLRHLTYGPTVRFILSWLDAYAHLGFSFRHETIELLVASTFLNALSPAPCSVLSGFVRFLHLLSKYPWSSCPLVVEFEAGAVSSSERQDLETMFIRSRAAATSDSRKNLLPTSSPHIYVMADYELTLNNNSSERSSSIWSQAQPMMDSRVCQMLIHHARTCLEELQDTIRKGRYNHTLNFLNQDSPLTREQYDVVFYLIDAAQVNLDREIEKTTRLRKPVCVNTVESSTTAVSPRRHDERIDFYPARECLARLQAQFSAWALFFLSHNQIGLVWKPQMCLVSESDELLHEPLPSILEAMIASSHGLIARVEIN